MQAKPDFSNAEYVTLDGPDRDIVDYAVLGVKRGALSVEVVRLDGRHFSAIPAGGGRVQWNITWADSGTSFARGVV